MWKWLSRKLDLVIDGMFWGLGLVITLTFLLWLTGHAHAQDVSVGDSIALGTGRALGVETHAKQSMGSCWIARQVPHKQYDHAVVSAGINDPPGPCVEAVIKAIMARHVVVILPAPINSARAHVASVAAKYGLTTISYVCAGGCTKRNFHPRSYAEVANNVRAIWYGTVADRLRGQPAVHVLPHR